MGFTGSRTGRHLREGQENCFLMTNGLGGFSSLTMIGSAARNDHAFFMGCTHAPNNRVNMIHRLSEVLQAGERAYPLSSQEFADGSREEGFRNLAEFSYEDTPVWRFLADGVEELRRKRQWGRGREYSSRCLPDPQPVRKRRAAFGHSFLPVRSQGKGSGGRPDI